MDMAGFINQYQSGLGALLGLGGVMLTLRVNARLDAQHQRRIADHERDILRQALLAELTMLRDNVQADVDQLKPMIKKDGVTFYLNVMLLTRMYDRVLDRLGLLTPDQARKVITAYSNAALLPSQVKMLKLSNAIKTSPHDVLGDSMIYVPAEISGSVVAMQEGQLRWYNEAVEALSRRD
jgi:plasmid stability protein